MNDKRRLRQKRQNGRWRRIGEVLELIGILEFMRSMRPEMTPTQVFQDRWLSWRTGWLREEAAIKSAALCSEPYRPSLEDYPWRYFEHELEAGRHFLRRTGEWMA